MYCSNFKMKVITAIIISNVMGVTWVWCLAEYNGFGWVASWTLLARLFSPLHMYHEGQGVVMMLVIILRCCNWSPDWTLSSRLFSRSLMYNDMVVMMMLQLMLSMLTLQLNILPKTYFWCFLWGFMVPLIDCSRGWIITYCGMAWHCNALSLGHRIHE